MALPSDDDEFEGDAVAYAPVIGTQVPYPVITQARHHLAQMALVGGGEIHGAFRIDYGTRSWLAVPRQDPFGGYKLLFIEIGGCTDRLGWLLVSRWDTDTAIAYFPDTTGEPPVATTTNETVDEPPDSASTNERRKTKMWKRPTLLVGPNGDAAPLAIPEYVWRRTGIGRPAASWWTGQMRLFLQCAYSRGSNTDEKFPFYNDYGGIWTNYGGGAWRTDYGIVEYPRPRVVGATAAEEKGEARKRKFWLVEVSLHGVYAMRIKSDNGENRNNCCGWSLPAFFFTESLWQRFGSDENIVQLLDTTATDVVYLNNGPLSPYGTWAFSYSGHEAQIIVQSKPQTFVGGYWRYSRRYKMTFTVTPGDPLVLSAAITLEEEKIATVQNFFMQMPNQFTASPSALNHYDLTGVYVSSWIVFNSSSGYSAELPFDNLLAVGFPSPDPTFPVHVYYWGDDPVYVDVATDGVIEVTDFVVSGVFSATYPVPTLASLDRTEFIFPWQDREAAGFVAYNGATYDWHLYSRGEQLPSINTGASFGGIVVFVMAGALYYDDQTLTDAVQQDNRVYIFDASASSPAFPTKAFHTLMDTFGVFQHSGTTFTPFGMDEPLTFVGRI